MSWHLYPGWGFGPEVFEPLLQRLPPRAESVCLVWSAGSFRFWEDLEANRVPPRAVLVAPIVRYTAGADFPDGVDPRALALLRRRIARDPAEGFAWFVGQAFDRPPSIRQTDWSRERLLAGLDELRDRDDRQRVSALCGKLRQAVIMACREDRVVPAGQARCVAELLRLPLEWLPGGSHAPFCEQPDDVAVRIGRWLAGGSRQGADGL